MMGTIQKWGNSQAVRIPKSVLQEVRLAENDSVEIKVSAGQIVICKAQPTSLAALFASYAGATVSGEWDTGASVGQEEAE